MDILKLYHNNTNGRNLIYFWGYENELEIRDYNKNLFWPGFHNKKSQIEIFFKFSSFSSDLQFQVIWLVRI